MGAQGTFCIIINNKCILFNSCVGDILESDFPYTDDTDMHQKS